MSVLSQLSSAHGRRDEQLNKKLAQKLVKTKDTKSIKEIVDNLANKDKSVQSSCASVLEQIGLLNSDLVADYVNELMSLLQVKNNRLVWGGMIVLGMVADKRPADIVRNMDTITRVIETGSIITKDNGVKVLAKTAAAGEQYSKKIVPFLLKNLKTCRPKDIPQYSESMMIAFHKNNKDQLATVLEKRLPELSSSQQARVKRVLKKLNE